MRLFQGDAEHDVPVRAWHWPPAKQETSWHSHVSGTQHYHSVMFLGTHSTTIQSCFRYTALPFSHVSGKQHYHLVMFQVHSTTIQSCFRYTAQPFSHVWGTQHCRDPSRHFFFQSLQLLTKFFKSEVIGNWKCRCCEVRGEGHKTGGCFARYLPFSSIKPGTHRAGLTGRFQNPSIWIIGTFIKTG